MIETPSWLESTIANVKPDSEIAETIILDAFAPLRTKALVPFRMLSAEILVTGLR